ncbi:U-box domain [Dillenia turbinata]|uniref:RING-type E3 ubiquitin transferase n=1 Tax=Dillenia turbinata TaxID=194707 RepID=A0AAN8VE14_9MAGN
MVTEKQLHKWKISFKRSNSVTSSFESKQPPSEFLCPISGSLMFDPVIVSSGHTFERKCVEICKTLNFTPTLVDGSKPDFSAVIPNLALKSTILNWANQNSFHHPKNLDIHSAEKIVRSLMEKQELEKKTCSEHELIKRVSEKSNEFNWVDETLQNDPKNCEIQSSESEKRAFSEKSSNGDSKIKHTVTDLGSRISNFMSDSGDSLIISLPFNTRPSCYSSPSSSSSEEALNPNSSEEEEILKKMKSCTVFEQEEAVILLRKLTKNREETRVSLCTSRILSAIRSLIVSRYLSLQVNSVAALVNLSLEKVNKVKIMRSGIVPPLINVLKGGFPEAQEHASGALFSLALDDDNKTAIGVLGALPALLHLMRSESERTRHDSAMALYHLSLVTSNRVKLVKLGSVGFLLGLVKSGHMVSRVLLIMGNLASCDEGQTAMLDAGAVGCLVGLLREEVSQSTSTQESCVAVLFGLSQGGLRFKGLAKEAGLTEVLHRVEKTGNGRAREKARRMLEMFKEREIEEVDLGEFIESGFNRTLGLDQFEQISAIITKQSKSPEGFNKSMNSRVEVSGVPSLLYVLQAFLLLSFFTNVADWPAGRRSTSLDKLHYKRACLANFHSMVSGES